MDQQESPEDAVISSPAYDAGAFLAFLEGNDMPHRLHHHDPVFTVAESEGLAAAIAGLHARNLFLKGKKGDLFLVTLEENRPLDLKRLAVLLGAGRFSFGSPALLWERLGVRPGSVTPFAILNDVARSVTLVLDADMMTAETINVHPLDNAMTIGVSPEILLSILEKHSVTPQIIDLKQALPDE